MKRKDSPPITPEKAALIKFLVRAKGLYQHQVAALLEINQGRVSEVINGKCHPNVEPDQGSFAF
jgi:predicted XRE-type DNA-binding protein